MRKIKLKQDCCFCDEFIKNKPFPIYTQNRVLLENKFSVAFPSLGAICNGHILIIPKTHTTSLALTPSLVLEYVLELRERVANKLTERFGSVVQFEHGVLPGEGGGCGVDHAHLHVLPNLLNQPLSSLLPLEMAEITASCFSELKNFGAMERPYLYIEESSGEKKIFFTEHLPSQFVRRIISSHIKSAEWDWTHRPVNNNFLATLSTFH